MISHALPRTSVYVILHILLTASTMAVIPVCKSQITPTHAIWEYAAKLNLSELEQECRSGARSELARIIFVDGIGFLLQVVRQSPSSQSW